MEDPFSHLLPSFMQFLTLSGARFVLLMGIMLFFGSIGGRLFQKWFNPEFCVIVDSGHKFFLMRQRV